MTTATCRVTFGQGPSEGEPFYVPELDDILNIDADGEVKTTFVETDTIWFVLHLEPGYVPAIAYQTDGMVTYCGPVTRSRTMEGAVWTPEDLSVELPHYPAGEVVSEWQGNEITLAPVRGRTLASLADDLSIMARADLTYTINCHLYRFDPPAGLVVPEEEDYIIDIMITLEAAA